MEKEYTNGLMGVAMMESTIVIKSMDGEYSIGLMELDIKVLG